MPNKTESDIHMVRQSSRWRVVVAVMAIIFGLATIWSGGSVVFGLGEARPDAGNFVPFVVWFNFLAGFFYVLAGFGMFFQQRWAAILSLLIAIATLFVFGALGIHIMNGGDFEGRTIGAMILRSVFWVTIAWFAKRMLSYE